MPPSLATTAEESLAPARVAVLRRIACHALDGGDRAWASRQLERHRDAEERRSGSFHRRQWRDAAAEALAAATPFSDRATRRQVQRWDGRCTALARTLCTSR